MRFVMVTVTYRWRCVWQEGRDGEGSGREERDVMRGGNKDIKVRY